MTLPIGTTALDRAAQDRVALGYVGFLGHTFVVMVDRDMPLPPRSAGCETVDIERARAYAREHAALNPALYMRSDRRRWLPITIDPDLCSICRSRHGREIEHPCE